VPLAGLATAAELHLSLPQDVKLLAFEENYHMSQLIRHRSDTTANETLDFLRSFVALWRRVASRSPAARGGLQRSEVAPNLGQTRILSKQLQSNGLERNSALNFGIQVE